MPRREDSYIEGGLRIVGQALLHPWLLHPCLSGCFAIIGWAISTRSSEINVTDNVSAVEDPVVKMPWWTMIATNMVKSVTTGFIFGLTFLRKSHERHDERNRRGFLASCKQIGSLVLQICFICLAVHSFYVDCSQILSCTGFLGCYSRWAEVWTLSPNIPATIAILGTTFTSFKSGVDVENIRAGGIWKVQTHVKYIYASSLALFYFWPVVFSIYWTHVIPGFFVWTCISIFEFWKFLWFSWVWDLLWLWDVTQLKEDFISFIFFTYPTAVALVAVLCALLAAVLLAWWHGFPILGGNGEAFLQLEELERADSGCLMAPDEYEEFTESGVFSCPVSLFYFITMLFPVSKHGEYREEERRGEDLMKEILDFQGDRKRYLCVVLGATIVVPFLAQFSFLTMARIYNSDFPDGPMDVVTTVYTAIASTIAERLFANYEHYVIYSDSLSIRARVLWLFS